MLMFPGPMELQSKAPKAEVFINFIVAMDPRSE